MCAFDASGMAPDAKIYDIALLQAGGGISGLLSDAIKAFQWAIDKYKNDGTPQILSNSWGMFQKSWAPNYATNINHPVTRKVVEAINTGIIVTFAAGNCGSQCPSGKCGTDTGPGKSIWGANGHPKVITVGAANIREEWIGYTSQGPAALDPKKPDFCAPSHFTGARTSDNGTSAACPICAGVIALYRSHDPKLRQDQAKEALQKTSKNLCSAGWDPHSGWGMIQGERAFNYLVRRPSALVHAMWTHGTSVHEEFPSPRHRLGLEIVTEAEVSHHLEERDVPGGGADDVDVDRSNRLLDRCCAVERSGLLTEEVGLERDHACIRHQQRRIRRDGGCGWPDDMSPLGEEVEECLANRSGVHGGGQVSDGPVASPTSCWRR